MKNIEKKEKKYQDGRKAGIKKNTKKGKHDIVKTR